MLRISNIKAPIELPVSILMQNLPREIGYRGRFKSCNIVKKALDARSKSRVHYVYSFDVSFNKAFSLSTSTSKL